MKWHSPSKILPLFSLLAVPQQSGLVSSQIFICILFFCLLWVTVCSTIDQFLVLLEILICRVRSPTQNIFLHFANKSYTHQIKWYLVSTTNTALRMWCNCAYFTYIILLCCCSLCTYSYTTLHKCIICVYGHTVVMVSNRKKYATFLYIDR